MQKKRYSGKKHIKKNTLTNVIVYFNHKGLTPLLATVLLIGMVVVISIVFFVWGFDFIEMLTEETGNTSLTKAQELMKGFSIEDTINPYGEGAYGEGPYD